MTKEQKPQSSEVAEERNLPTPVHIGSPEGGSAKRGDLYSVRGSEVSLTAADNKSGMRRNGGMNSKSLIRTKSSEGYNSYLVQSGVMINAQRSIRERRLMITDIWGSAARETGINLVVGEQGKIVTQSLGEVQGVLVQTGKYELVDSSTQILPDVFSDLEANISAVVPNYRQSLEAAIEHFDERSRSAGQVALQ